jgi:hypothetical protein
VAKKRSQGEKSKKARGRRFQHGNDDLEQLKGIETEQQRSRKARVEQEKSDDDPPAGLPPLIDRIEKSKDRVRNRLDKVMDYEDAIREFGS